MSSQDTLFTQRECRRIPVSLKTAPSTEKIAIAGLESVLNPDTCYWRKLTWATILLTCSILALLQTHDRVEKYLSYPIKSHVSHVRYNSLPYPVVTICPNRGRLDKDTSHVDAEKVKNLWKKHYPEKNATDGILGMYHALADHYDVHSLWTKTAFSYDKLRKDCYVNRGYHCDEVGEFQLLYSVSGVCYSYRGPYVNMAGVYFGMYMKFCAAKSSFLPSLRVHIHYSNENESLAMRVLEGHPFQAGWNKEIGVALREFHSQDTPTKPCDDDERFTVQKCKEQCYYRSFVQQMGCRMPYMNVLSVPYCNSSRQLKNAEAMQQSWIWEGQEQQSEVICSCERTACTDKFVSLTTDVSQRATGKECARLKVYFSSMSVEETREEFSYGIISLLCDVGGTLGLLLGASVLTFVQICDGIVLKIISVLRPKLGY